MILLWGVAEDSPLRATQEALLRRGATVFFLDQRRARETVLELRGWAAGEIRLGDDRCDLALVKAVYLRCGESQLLTQGADRDAALASHARALDEAVSAFLDTTPALLVKGPSDGVRNQSRWNDQMDIRPAFRLQRICRGGFHNAQGD